MNAVFLTGGSSPLGSHLLPDLVASHGTVLALARSETAATTVRASGATVVRGDLLDPSTWRAEAQECHAFIHLAGIRFAPQLLQAVNPNQRLIAVSSASVANRHHPLATELTRHEGCLRSAHRPSAILRPTMIYGTAGDRNVRYLALLLTRLPRVPAFTGGGKIQPIHVDDVVAAIMRQLAVPRYEVLSLGGPGPIQVHELVDIIANDLALRRIPIRVPLWPLARLASLAPPLAKVHRAVHALQMLAHDRTVGAPDDALFGRAPTSLRAGVRAALVAYGLLLP